MTPTPTFRPYSISLDKRTWWALRTISKGLIGDGGVKPELTPDGIAATLLTEVIERRFPDLLDGFKQREAVDADYVKRVSLADSVLYASNSQPGNHHL